jgi:hypothetical protein
LELHVEISYDYNNISTSNSDKNTSRPRFFNGDATTFSWWKTMMYNHIIEIDDELWDIVDEGVTFDMDEEGVVSNAKRKLFTTEQREQYKKHHKVKGILLDSLTHAEYLKIVDKSSAKSIFDSLCSTYEGNQQVKEAKANLLVQQYELFKMKEDEDIETMFARFQTLVSGLQVLKKSYTTPDHVKKILRSLPVKWRPKVTAIQESKNLNDLSLENLISSLKSHELELLTDEPVKKSKPLALKSSQKSSKALKAKVIEYEEEEASEEVPEEESEDEEMILLTKRFQQWARKNKKFSSRSGGSRMSRALL